MTRGYKKNQERLFAKAAARGLGEEWVLLDIPEPLDFIVQHPGGDRFGLEVMELHDSPLDKGGSSLKEAESKQRRKLREVIARYYDAGGRPVRVNILGEIIDPCSLVKSLLNLRVDVEGQEGVLEVDQMKIWVLPLPEGDAAFERYSRWQIADASFVREIPAELVVLQITSKAKKLKSYLDKVTAVDLLLVVDRTSNAGRFTLSRKVIYPTLGFRRIILLTYPLSAEILVSFRDDE